MANTRFDLGRAERFRYFRKKYVANGMQNAEKLLTIGKTRISRIEKGEEQIPITIIDLLVKDFDLNRDWLLENKGNPIKNDQTIKTGLQSTMQMGDRIDALNTKIRLLEANLNHAHYVIDTINKRLDRLEKNK